MRIEPNCEVFNEFKSTSSCGIRLGSPKMSDTIGKYSDEIQKIQECIKKNLQKQILKKFY